MLFSLYRTAILLNQIMKSFEQISNLELGGLRRNGVKSIINKTQPSIPTETNASGKSSSLNGGEMQTIYVKEFFDHFFQKKSMLQVMTQISNAIHVLQTLITDFQNKKGIISDCKMHFQHKVSLSGNFPNVIQREGGQISEAIEDIYNRLQKIFDQLGSEQKQSWSSPKPFQGSQSNRDQQLYQMLNDYKTDNKKQKQLRKKAEVECIDLRKELSKLQDEKKKIVQQQRDIELHECLLKKRIVELEAKVDDLNAQIETHINEKDQMTEKFNLLCEINENLSSTSQQNQDLKTKLRQFEQKEILLTKKFEALEDVIKKRIQSKDDKWTTMIESKLTSKTLFENASCSAFRQFMGSMQKLNKC